MKIPTVLFLLLVACNNNKSANPQPSIDSLKTNSQDSPVNEVTVPTTIENNELKIEKSNRPDTIGGKPVSFYIDNPKVAPIAKALFKGQFRPSDNDSTVELLSYVTTQDSVIRPFYRWCLDYTISISDGALAEYPGEPALRYASKFPLEFFDYMHKDTSGERYNRWTEIIAYSGLDDYNKKSTDIQKEIIGKMLLKCSHCNEDVKSKIKKFAKDVAETVILINCCTLAEPN